jgi:CBS domain-containing protein
MRAKDVMATALVLARPEMTVRDAATALVSNHISGMPVVNAHGTLVGMITEGDLLRRPEMGATTKRRAGLLEFLVSTRELAAEYVKAHSRQVSDVMTTDIVAVTEETPLGEIAKLMEEHQIKRVPVLSNGELKGLVSRSDLIRALASVWPHLRDDSTTGDQQIREAILAELRGNRWTLLPQNVMVANGVAHLWGVISSEEEGKAIRVAAENIPGVKKVESHLVYPSIPLY